MTNNEAIITLKANYPDACFEQLREAVDAAIEALKAQEQLANNSSELDNNIGDIISRTAAIEAIDKIFPADPMRNDYTQGITCGAALAEEYIKQLPPAQPETHEERTETHACDLIDRQAAIDAMCELMHHWFGGDSKDEIREIKRELENLPSAQPETAKRIVGKSRDGMTLWYQCDMCNEPVDEQDNYCRGCGRRLIDG